MLDTFNETMLNTALSTHLMEYRPGLIFHICDIFIEELSKVLGTYYYCEIGLETTLKIFGPFTNIIVNTREKTITAKIEKEIIEEFLSHLIDLRSDDESDKKLAKKRLETFTKFLTKLMEFFKANAKAKETPEKNRATLYALTKTILLNLDNK